MQSNLYEPKFLLILYYSLIRLNSGTNTITPAAEAEGAAAAVEAAAVGCSLAWGQRHCSGRGKSLLINHPLTSQDAEDNHAMMIGAGHSAQANNCTRAPSYFAERFIYAH